jgi:hypothetical protein
MLLHAFRFGDGCMGGPPDFKVCGWCDFWNRARARRSAWFRARGVNVETWRAFRDAADLSKAEEKRADGGEQQP